MTDTDNLINYRVPETFMDEHKAATSDFGQNRYRFLVVCNIEWKMVWFPSLPYLFAMSTSGKVQWYKCGINHTTGNVTTGQCRNACRQIHPTSNHYDRCGVSRQIKSLKLSMFWRASATWKDARTNETNPCFKLKHEAHPESYLFTTWKDT